MDIELSSSREIAHSALVQYPASGVATYQKRLYTAPKNIDELGFMRMSSAVRLTEGKRRLGLIYYTLKETVYGRQIYELLDDERLHPGGLEELIACVMHGNFSKEFSDLYAPGSRARIGSGVNTRIVCPALLSDSKHNISLELCLFDMHYNKGQTILCAIELS